VSMCFMTRVGCGVTDEPRKHEERKLEKRKLEKRKLEKRKLERRNYCRMMIV
jgi:hypothetical protein